MTPALTSLRLGAAVTTLVEHLSTVLDLHGSFCDQKCGAGTSGHASRPLHRGLFRIYNSICNMYLHRAMVQDIYIYIYVYSIIMYYGTGHLDYEHLHAV